VSANAKLLIMYLGIDIGGTKTLIASLDENGVIKESIKFPTDQNYKKWLSDLGEQIGKLENKDFVAVGVGVPGPGIDRSSGTLLNSSNLAWHNVSLQDDIEDLTHTPVAMENDAKLAALSEAMILKDEYQSVLYITISTGIGYGLVVNQQIDVNVGDGGGRTILLEHEGQSVPWESFASGKAIVERYGKMAKDIDDEETWEAISRDLAKGFIELIAITEPDVIVIGGSVGTHFHKYKKPLEQEIKKYHVPLIKMPALVEAKRPEQAVVYGCYDYVKQRFPNASSHK
jgi:predicted NBD/HSP70 family sugar kinase